MADKLYDQVWERAKNRCEYCQMLQSLDAMTFEVDHIIPRKAGGPTTAENLALACYSCNKHKGPNLASIDPEGDSETAVQLFHPRKDDWSAHFQWAHAELTAKTATGRATLSMLQINSPLRVEHREWLLEAGVFPTN